MKNIFTQMNGIEIYGIISICIFVSIFATALVWTFLLKQPFLKSMGALPLDEGRKPGNAKEESHEQ